MQSKFLRALEKQSYQEIILPGLSETALIRPITAAEDNLLSTANFLSIKNVYDVLLKTIYSTVEKIGEAKPSYEEF